MDRAMTEDRRIDPVLEARLGDIGQQLAETLPEGVGFALLFFDLDAPDSRMNYFSNAERGSMICALRELIAFMEATHHGSKSKH
jgi:hypothetical protein